MKQPKIYHADWEKSERSGIEEDFNITLDKDIEILFAAYTYEDYSGSAFVLFRQEGKLFEVNGGHCSCYGLSDYSYGGSNESQWQPEETTIKALEDRNKKGSIMGYDGEFKKEITAVLKWLKEA